MMLAAAAGADFGYNDVEYNNGGQGEGWTKTPNMNRAAMRGVKLDSYCAPPHHHHHTHTHRPHPTLTQTG